MRSVHRRTVLAALAAALTVALLPTAADAHGHRPGPTPRPRPTELTAVYVYKKFDAGAPASWENSGRQRLVLVRDGLAWVDSLEPSVLPVDVCGGGWAVQEDQIRGLSREEVPQVVDRATGEGVLTWPPVVADRHRELSAYVSVPACPPVEPGEPVGPGDGGQEPGDGGEQPGDGSEPPGDGSERPGDDVEPTRPVTPPAVTPGGAVPTAPAARPVVAAPTFAG